MNIFQDVLYTGMNAGRISLHKHPTFAILGSGSSRAMGSRWAVTRFVDAVRSSGIPQLQLWFEPSSTKFSFANSNAAKVREKLVIRFLTDKPCKTEIHVVEQGYVPILFPSIR